MVNIRFFTSSRNVNGNWFMNVPLSHEISHVSYLNLEAYIEATCNPWRRIRNLLVVICFLSELKKNTKFFKKCFKVV
jgi:hypothetical protein